MVGYDRLLGLGDIQPLSSVCLHVLVPVESSSRLYAESEGASACNSCHVSYISLTVRTGKGWVARHRARCVCVHTHSQGILPGVNFNIFVDLSIFTPSVRPSYQGKTTPLVTIQFDTTRRGENASLAGYSDCLVHPPLPTQPNPSAASRHLLVVYPQVYRGLATYTLEDLHLVDNDHVC